MRLDVWLLNRTCKKIRRETGCSCVEDGCEHLGWCDACFDALKVRKKRIQTACELFLAAIGIAFVLVILVLLWSLVVGLWQIIT